MSEGNSVTPDLPTWLIVVFFALFRGYRRYFPPMLFVHARSTYERHNFLNSF